MHAPLKTHAQIDQLTGIRAVAITAVLLAHFGHAITVLLHLPMGLKDLFDYGGYGVPLFFALSGFVIAYQYEDNVRDLPTYGQFLWKRIARIFPSHLLALFGTIAIYAVASRFGYTPTIFDFSLFLQHVTLTQGWWHYQSGVWNSPSWSLSAEWFVYLAFPLIEFTFKRLKLPVSFILYGYGAVFLFIGTMQAFGIVSLFPWQTSLPHVVSFFIAGYAAFKVWQVSRAAHLPERFYRYAVWTAIAFSCVSTWAALTYPAINSWWLTLPFPLLIWGLAGDTRSSVSRFLQWPQVVLLGKASFAIYITHITPQLIMYKFVPFESYATAPFWLRICLIFFYLSTVIGIGYATHLLFENPVRKKLVALGNTQRHKKSVT